MHNYYVSTWEQERYRRYIFPVICNSAMKNLAQIHPLRQKQVDAVYRAMQGDPNVFMIVIFGSSLNLRCTINSDLDLAVKLKDGHASNEIKTEIYEKIQDACDWNLNRRL